LLTYRELGIPIDYLAFFILSF